MKQPAVYIVASKRNETLYVGVTSNLINVLLMDLQKSMDVNY